MISSRLGMSFANNDRMASRSQGASDRKDITAWYIARE